MRRPVLVFLFLCLSSVGQAHPDPEIIADLQSFDGGRISRALDQIGELRADGAGYLDELLDLRLNMFFLSHRGVPPEVQLRICPTIGGMGPLAYFRVREMLRSVDMAERHVAIELLPQFYDAYPEALELMAAMVFDREKESANLANAEVGDTRHGWRVIPFVQALLLTPGVWPTRDRGTWKDARLLDVAHVLNESLPTDPEVTAFIEKLRARMVSIHSLRGEMVLLTMLRLRKKKDPQLPMDVYTGEVYGALRSMFERGVWDEDVKKLVLEFEMADTDHHSGILGVVLRDAPEPFRDAFITRLAKRRKAFFPARFYLGKGATCREQIEHLAATLKETP